MNTIIGGLIAWLGLGFSLLGLLAVLYTLYVLARGIGIIREGLNKKENGSLKANLFSVFVWIPIIFTIIFIRNI